MGFKDFSLNISQTKVARFAEELAAGKIMSTRCRVCGKKYYPPKADCPACMGSDMDWSAIEATGQLVTYTRIYVPPERFSIGQPPMPFSSIHLEPCPVGLIETVEGLRVMGWMPKIDFKAIRVGMKLKCLPHLFPDGKVTIILAPVE